MNTYTVVVNAEKTRRRNIMLLIVYGLAMMAAGLHYGRWSRDRVYSAPMDALMAPTAAPAKAKRAPVKFRIKELDC